MTALIMEEGCTVSGKVTGFSKMIGTEMQTINAEARVISAAKKEAAKDKKQLQKEAAKIKAPQVSCDA